jgi:hypothetical protein
LIFPAVSAENFFAPMGNSTYRSNLEAGVQAYLEKIAEKKDIQLSDLANELLKREIALLEGVK